VRRCSVDRGAAGKHEEENPNGKPSALSSQRLLVSVRVAHVGGARRSENNSASGSHGSDRRRVV
jgi:hypothetical protein